jgi:hypothetical protein
MIDIVQIKEPLLRDLEKATKAIIAGSGIKENSELIKSIRWNETEDDSIMTLIANDYFIYADEGRRKGKMPPVEPLIKWIKKNNINTKGLSINEMAFMIANAIKRNGVMGKFFSGEIIESTTDIVAEELANTMAENICEAIVQAIENKNF